MDFIFENKIIICIIVGIITTYLFYSKDTNIETTDTIDTDNVTPSILKGLGIGLLIYLILYFTDDNDNEVFNYIDVGEPKF
jgi:uncharacterized protein with PQ loop repeat